MTSRQHISIVKRYQRPRPDANNHAGILCPPLIVVAGVPGAGKTEALKNLRSKAHRVRVADPELVRHIMRRWIPWLPYTYGRPIVHTIAHLWALAQILHRAGGPLVVHDPGTRKWSRRLIVDLAILLGYSPMIIYIDTDRDSALNGQIQRQRVVRSQSFARHWRRWTELRKRILEEGDVNHNEAWIRVELSRREDVVDDLLGLLKSELHELP